MRAMSIDLSPSLDVVPVHQLNSLSTAAILPSPNVSASRWSKKRAGPVSDQNKTKKRELFSAGKAGSAHNFGT
jgi:hypothetical protein